MVHYGGGDHRNACTEGLNNVRTPRSESESSHGDPNPLPPLLRCQPVVAMKEGALAFPLAPRGGRW
jgi:hypothetical protein